MMRDVLMVALMIGSIIVFAAYVALCDRIIGTAEPANADAGNAGSSGTRRERELAA